MGILKFNKNFRNLWLGRLFSNAGDSVYYVVLSWYLITTTKDPFWVGFINFAIFIPNIFSFLIGHIIDNYNKKHILIILEIGQAFFLCILIIAIYFNFDNPYIISLIAFLIAFFGQNTYAVQDAIIPILVEEKDLESANKYMSAAYNTSDYLFNAISGIIIKLMSTVYILLLDLLSFVLSIISFSKIEYKEKESLNEDKGDFWSGFKLIYEDKSLVYLTFTSGYLNMLFGGLGVYQVIIANEFESSVYYGILLGILSLGVVIGNSYGVTVILKKLKLGLAIITNEILKGIPLVLLFFTSDKYLILVFFFVFGIFLGITHVIMATYFQKAIPSNKLGRFYSATYTLTVSAFPLGALLFGYVAKYMSYNYFMLLFGVNFIIIGISMSKFRKIKNFE
ncbi:MFS transporter [Oceanivirga miroungae]|uniref:Major facilitator superfamily (MFS) profile domain-containing protein n=1 Tax=Oceanivirga miroungae TaxID=1130046 RepID=A0A6I8M9D3_9FUSO|nr:MFS transporter [Oceanivirga miroungae]VWL84878.1 hypothetical protein OMES3154_00135 [Oceanivirga miroungae]